MKMKKIIALVAAMTMTMAMTVGCGSSDEGTKEKVFDTGNEISILSREDGSGTRGAFEELLGIEDSCAYAQELDSTGAVLAKVGVTAGAIGYVSLDVVDDSVNAMSLNGVAATEENIIAGNYLLSRPFVMATMGEVANQNELVQLWFDYINSEAGQNIIKSAGLNLPK